MSVDNEASPASLPWGDLWPLGNRKEGSGAIGEADSEVKRTACGDTYPRESADPSQLPPPRKGEESLAFCQNLILR